MRESKKRSQDDWRSLHSGFTFRLFPVGDPHRADAVGLRGQVFEVDHHTVTSLDHNHWALNTCNQDNMFSEKSYI